MNSPYVDYIRLTNKHSGIRTQKVQAFVLHHMAGVMTGKECAEYFQRTARSCSSNYCIGPDGDVAMNVEEQNRAWTSSSNWADQRAITFELSNSKYGHPWTVSDATIRKVILMLAEMHKRYGLKKCTYTGDTRGTLWRHDFFANTNCPGPYLAGKLPFIADEVNKILNNNSAKPQEEKPTKKPESKFEPGLYKVITNSLNIRKGPGTNYRKVGEIRDKGTYTIVEVQGNWGKLKSGAGWIWIPQLTKRVGGTQSPTKPKKTIDELVKEVKAGKWGNYPERKTRLEAAGYNYAEVQAQVNASYGQTPKKSNEQLADEVIAGKWGDGEDRKNRLAAAGYNYKAVQTIVNRKLGY